MTKDIPSLRLMDDISVDELPVHFIRKEKVGNGTMLLTVPGQVIKKKRGAPDKIIAGLRVSPIGPLTSSMEKTKKSVPEHTVFVTTTLRKVCRKGGTYYECADLYLLENCPESVRSIYEIISAIQ